MKFRRVIARLVAVSMVLGGLLAISAAPAHALSCYDGWMRSDANNKYVSAELGYSTTSPYYGMLRARASSSSGPWERFEFCWGVNNNPGNLAIRSLANGKWVSAELGRTGNDYAMLRARASSIGPWETFNGLSGLRNSTNWKWVTAELGQTGSRDAMLRARANSYGPWEHFSNTGPQF